MDQHIDVFLYGVLAEKAESVRNHEETLLLLTLDVTRPYRLQGKKAVNTTDRYIIVVGSEFYQELPKLKDASLGDKIAFKGTIQRCGVKNSTPMVRIMVMDPNDHWIAINPKPKGITRAKAPKPKEERVVTSREKT